MAAVSVILLLGAWNWTPPATTPGKGETLIPTNRVVDIPPVAMPSERTEVAIGSAGRTLMIVDEALHPVPQARAILCQKGSRSCQARDAVGTSGDDGIIWIPPERTTLRSGQELVIACIGFQSVVVTPGDETVVLKKGVVVRGVAHDDQGVPVSGVRVTMSRGQIAATSSEDASLLEAGATEDSIVSATSRPDGSFELGGLVAGRHSIKIGHPTYGVRHCSALETRPLVVPCQFVEITMTPILECVVQFTNDAALQMAYTYPDVILTDGVAGESVRRLRPRMTRGIVDPADCLSFYGIPNLAGAVVPEEVPFLLYVWLKRGGPVCIPLVLRRPELASPVTYSSIGQAPLGQVRVSVRDADGRVIPMRTRVRYQSGRLRRIPPGVTVDPQEIGWGKTLDVDKEYELPAGRYEAEIVDPNLNGVCKATSFEISANKLCAIDITIPIATCVVRFRADSVAPNLTIVERGVRQGVAKYIGFLTMEGSAAQARVTLPRSCFDITVSAAGYESVSMELLCEERAQFDVALPTLKLLR